MPVYLIVFLRIHNKTIKKLVYNLIIDRIGGYKTMAKRLIGKLPVNQKYKVITIDYKPLNELSATTCDNCDKIISNIASIKNESGKVYNVGLDCASTMQLYQNNEVFNLIEAKKKLARRARFVKWYKTKKQGQWVNENNIWFYERPVNEWSVNFTYRMNYEYFKRNYPYLN